MVSVFFDVNRTSGDIYGINDISPRFLETVKLLKMKSIQVIASLLCGILYCGISLNAQNVLKATGWIMRQNCKKNSGIQLIIRIKYR